MTDARETTAALRDRRKAARITQSELAAEIPGWTQQIVSAKESGKRGTWLHELDLWLGVLERLEREER